MLPVCGAAGGLLPEPSNRAVSSVKIGARLAADVQHALRFIDYAAEPGFTSRVSPSLPCAHPGAQI